MTTEETESTGTTKECPAPTRAKTSRGCWGCLGSFVVLVVILSTVTIPYSIPPSAEQRERMNQAWIGILENDFGRLCSDAGVSNIRQLFSDPSSLDRPDLQTTIALHTEIAYKLLRYGRDADCTFAPGVKEKLSMYYDHDFLEGGREQINDPWGNPYQFFIPPWPQDGIGNVKSSPFTRHETKLPATNQSAKNGTNSEPVIYVIWSGPEGQKEAQE